MNFPNIYAHRGRQLLSQYRERHEDIPRPDLPKIRKILNNPRPSSTSPVCIIGAGMAGLYTAMILKSLEIDYQIVDANTRERVGGRIFTHHFPGGGSYDYCDVGVMRFPDTPFMKRVFDLIRNRNLSVTLIPFIMEMVEPSPNTFLFYNNARVNNQDHSIVGDPFDVLSYVGEPDLTTPQGVSQKVAEVLQRFRDRFRTRFGDRPPDIAAAIGWLYEQAGGLSMRAYMSQVVGMDDKQISWCETLDKSTGWYDRALAETVIESLALDWPTAPLPGPEPPNPGPDLRWHCIDGGSSILPKAMFNSLPVDVQEAAKFKSPVTDISHNAGDNTMRISISDIPSTQSYSAIISTIPLPRLSIMGLTGVGINLNYAQWSAIRELQYTPAIKIGILFTTPWWETELEQPIHGGQSYTDLPLRTIVYPSYPYGVAPEEMSKVLIVSYCWTQDAERMGAITNSDGTMKPELFNVVFRDLAAVHGVPVKWLLERYAGQHIAWDWLRDPLAMGGFALFGPGVYENGDIYNKILKPAAGGKLFFAGEATSSCHGWVAGALDSAWRAVDNYLALNHPEEVREKFWKLWGPTEYWDEDPELIKLHRELLDQHLAITLHEAGILVG